MIVRISGEVGSSSPTRTRSGSTSSTTAPSARSSRATRAASASSGVRCSSLLRRTATPSPTRAGGVRHHPAAARHHLRGGAGRVRGRGPDPGLARRRGPPGMSWAPRDRLLAGHLVAVRTVVGQVVRAGWPPARAAAARAGLPSRRRPGLRLPAHVLRREVARGGHLAWQSARVRWAAWKPTRSRLYDRSDQLEQVQSGLLEGEQLYAVYDAKGGGTGFIGLTDRRVIPTSHSWAGRSPWSDPVRPHLQRGRAERRASAASSSAPARCTSPRAAAATRSSSAAPTRRTTRTT